jgi:hypothetical protein
MSELKNIVASLEQLLDDAWNQANSICDVSQEFDEASGRVTTLYMTACTVKQAIFTLSAKLAHYTEKDDSDEEEEDSKDEE